MFLLCLISVFVFVLYLSFGRSSLGFFFSGFSFFSLSAELASMWYMCGIVQKKKKKKNNTTHSLLFLCINQKFGTDSFGFFFLVRSFCLFLFWYWGMLRRHEVQVHSSVIKES